MPRNSPRLTWTVGLLMGLTMGSAWASLPATLARIEKGQGVVAINMGTQGIQDMRVRLLRRTAYTLGVQGGAHGRYQHIDTILNQHAATLDQIFNFGPLLLNNSRVLPPVMEVVHGAMRLSSTIKGSSVITAYRIEAPAQLVSLPPSWRSYLLQSFPPLSRVSRLLMPKNDREWRIWRHAVSRGWTQGIQEANAVYSSELHSLQRDYLGMLRFHMLVAQKMVSVPVLATGNLGITVNGRRLAIGQKIFQITWPAHFRRPHHWRVRAVAVPRRPPA